MKNFEKYFVDQLFDLRSGTDQPSAAASKVKGGKSCLAQSRNICYQFPNQRVRFARPRAITRFHHRYRNVIVLNLLLLFIISFFKLQRSVPDPGPMVHT